MKCSTLLNLCKMIWRCPSQKQPPELFYKEIVLKNFAKFTEKHLCGSVFLNQGGLRPDSGKGVSSAKYLETYLSYRTPPVAAFVQ